MARAGIELDAKVDFGLHEREIAVLAHGALDEHLAARVEDVHGDADGLAAVAEAAFARDRVVAVVVTISNGVAAGGRRGQQGRR